MKKDRVLSYWTFDRDKWCLTKDDGKKPCYRVHRQTVDSLGNPAWEQTACLYYPKNEGTRDWLNLSARSLAEKIAALASGDDA